MDYFSAGEVKGGPGGRKVEKLARIDQRRTRRSHVDLPRAAVEESLSVVLELGSTDDRVFADQHGHHFRGVGDPAGGFGKVAAAAEGMDFKLVNVVDPPDRDDGKSAQVRADHQRLSVVVADDADPLAALNLDRSGSNLERK